MCLRPGAGALENLFHRIVGDMICREVLLDFPHVFAVVDTSPIFINQLFRHQEHYSSGKYIRHCVHLSRVDRGATHDRAIFGRSEVATFLTYQDYRGHLQHKPIMGDLGYIGITRTCPSAVLWHKRPRMDLTKEPKTENEALSPNRMLVANFFAQWKCLFAVAVPEYGGDLGRLDPIARATIAMTTSHFQRHPLCGREETAADSSDGDGGAVASLARELDEPSLDVVSLPQKINSLD
jgi:hypothetical protein